MLSRRWTGSACPKKGVENRENGGSQTTRRRFPCALKFDAPGGLFIDDVIGAMLLRLDVELQLFDSGGPVALRHIGGLGLLHQLGRAPLLAGKLEIDILHLLGRSLGDSFPGGLYLFVGGERLRPSLPCSSLSPPFDAPALCGCPRSARHRAGLLYFTRFSAGMQDIEAIFLEISTRKIRPCRAVSPSFPTERQEGTKTDRAGHFPRDVPKGGSAPARACAGAFSRTCGPPGYGKCKAFGEMA